MRPNCSPTSSSTTANWVYRGSSSSTTVRATRRGELVLQQPDAHLFSASGSYARSQCGMQWIRHLLHRFGSGRWCVLADADEFLVYPQMERVGLKELCAYLDARRLEGLTCLLLDMYSDQPIRDTVYASGRNPLEVCPFFDPASHYEKRWLGEQWLLGGVRHRMFDVEACLQKASIVKFSPSRYLFIGYHRVWHARLAPMFGAVLHFKFFSTFYESAKREAARGEHWNNAGQYKKYWEVLQSLPRSDPRLRRFGPLSGNGTIAAAEPDNRHSRLARLCR